MGAADIAADGEQDEQQEIHDEHCGDAAMPVLAAGQLTAQPGQLLAEIEGAAALLLCHHKLAGSGGGGLAGTGMVDVRGARLGVDIHRNLHIEADVEAPLGTGILGLGLWLLLPVPLLIHIFLVAMPEHGHGGQHLTFTSSSSSSSWVRNSKFTNFYRSLVAFRFFFCFSSAQFTF